MGLVTERKLKQETAMKRLVLWVLRSIGCGTAVM
jgi:hypothetical protein